MTFDSYGRRMKPVLLVVVVLAGLLGWVGFRFARYRQSAAVHWRDAVRLRRDALAAALQALGGPPPPDPAAALYDRHFRRLIATIPLDRLAEFPGVGAGTINQLKQAGLTDLPGVAAARVGDIPKVGDKRGNDVLAAAQALLAEARGRFDAGGCPEAIDYRREVAALRVDTTPDMVRQHAVRAATADAVRQLDALLPTADAVTFVGFLLGRPVPGLTPTLLARPLPEPVVPPDPPPFDGPAGAAADPAYTVSPPTKLTKPSKVAASGPLPSAPIGPPADVFRAELDRASAVQVVPSRPGEVPLVAKVRAFARFGILIAKADGRVAQSERKEVRDFLTGTFGYDANLLRHIDPAIEQAEKNSADEPQAVAELRALLSPAECDQLYRFAERVADAAGDRNAKETEALARIAAGLGVSPVRSSEFGVSEFDRRRSAGTSVDAR